MSNGSLLTADGDRDRSAEVRFIIEIVEKESDVLIQTITREQLRDTLNERGSFERTAEVLIPVQHATSETVSSTIISRTARLLLTEDEYRDAVRNSFSKGQKRRPEGSHPLCDPDFRRQIAESLGHRLWENEVEIQWLEELAADPDYQHDDATHSGDPDFERIATVLNDFFWQGVDYRDGENCRMKMHHVRKRRGEIMNTTFRRWSTEERVMLMQLVANPDFKHEGGSLDGMCDMDRILHLLNLTFWDGQEIRTNIKCWKQIRYIRKNESVRQSIEEAGGFEIEPFQST